MRQGIGGKILTHISIQEKSDGSAVKWMAKVNYGHYQTESYYKQIYRALLPNPLFFRFC